MFLDEKVLQITAGRGGDGVALFRREIYVPRGGADGGDGGNGGSVYVEGKHNLHALSHLSHVEGIKAQPGEKGGHKTSTGKSGSDATVEVPLGTVIEIEQEDGSWRPGFEIVEEGEPHLLAKGGNGGWGNWHFKSSVNQTPDRSNPGLPGEKLRIRLVLKLIADIGLVGLPNAGKSTFLSIVSSARPKIANYPFTTLEPQLGVVDPSRYNISRQMVIADLPGLIEGASSGKGLGTAFLKHVERTRTIIHFLDSSMEEGEIIAAYRVIRHELESWSPVLGKKTEIVALSKSDTVAPDELPAKIQRIQKAIKKPVYAISSAAHAGIAELLNAAAAPQA